MKQPRDTAKPLQRILSEDIAVAFKHFSDEIAKLKKGSSATAETVDRLQTLETQLIATTARLQAQANEILIYDLADRLDVLENSATSITDQLQLDNDDVDWCWNAGMGK